MELRSEFVAHALPGSTMLGRMPACITGEWVVDSRIVKSGDAFVAVRGQHHDGHDFIADALRAGASLIMCSRERRAEIERVFASYDTKATLIIAPENTPEALCALASVWRQQFSYPVVGITGSVGKTTTKELVADILRAAGMRVVVSKGNQNTLIGLSLNMLQMTADHDCAVFEMGVSRRGEMAQLSHLVQPTMGVITAIGHSHMEGIGSLADIAAEKRDIFKYLRAGGVGIINGDQPLLSAVAYAQPMIRCGLRATNQVQARQVRMEPSGISCNLKLYGRRYAVRLATENQARVYNVVTAVAVCNFLGVSDAIIIERIQREIALQGRFVKHLLGGERRLLIDDSYNANPESMKSALLAFERIEQQAFKVAVLGDMLELGPNSAFWHRQLGRFLRKVPSLNHVIFVGNHVAWARKTAPYSLACEVVATWDEAAERFRAQVGTQREWAALVKGSRGIALHNLVAAVRADHA